MTSIAPAPSSTPFAKAKSADIGKLLSISDDPVKSPDTPEPSSTIPYITHTRRQSASSTKNDHAPRSRRQSPSTAHRFDPPLTTPTPTTKTKTPRPFEHAKSADIGKLMSIGDSLDSLASPSHPVLSQPIPALKKKDRPRRQSKSTKVAIAPIATNQSEPVLNNRDRYYTPDLELTFEKTGVVGADDVVHVLIECCVGAWQLGKSKVGEEGRLLKVLVELKDNYIARLPDLRYHSTPPPLPAHPAASLPSPAPAASPADAAVICHHLTMLHERAWTLNDRLKRYASATSPLFWVRRKKVHLLVEKVLEAWKEVILDLTLAIAHSSSDVARAATGNVAKLAVATGSPDWEVRLATELHPDDAAYIFMQGEKYFHGYGVPKSYDIAFRRYMTAAKSSHPSACNMLGVMYEHGLGRGKDMVNAITWYKKALTYAPTHTEALNNMGRIHETGKGTPVDLRTAAEYYLKAAEGGSVDAMCSYGYLLEHAMGVEKPDAEGALKWYMTAAQSGYARAQNAIGSCYYRGHGVARDRGEAVVWYRRAAAQGDPHAQNNLGICYEEGSGVQKDYVMAKTYYKMAADARHPSGLNNMGFMCVLEKNYMAAVRYFHLATAVGSIEAYYYLGTLHEAGCRDVHGVVVNPDFEMAARYYREAADMNHTKSLLRLSTILLHAPPPLQNRQEAYAYLLRAASPTTKSSTKSGTEAESRSVKIGNDSEAQYLLGRALEMGLVREKGEGGKGEVPKPDPASAAKWYRRATRQGHAKATHQLALLYEYGKGVEKDHERAVELFTEAERRGYKGGHWRGGGGEVEEDEE
ncbi:hypothetical protein HDV00_002001 [Rhizophlyctis rosea]|nr:hypothetical protein HDV00_002001 [Rhizophlyctis rosea]